MVQLSGINERLARLPLEGWNAAFAHSLCPLREAYKKLIHI